MHEGFPEILPPVKQLKREVKIMNKATTLAIKPAFESNNIPLVFNFSKSYTPAFTVCLLSGMRNFSTENNYDIIILERALTEENKAVIKYLTKGHKNISVRYLNPEKFFKDMKYFMSERLPVEGFFRSAASFFLTEYDKILYLDSDILIKEDVAHLFHTNVEGYLLAAVQDLVAKAFLNMKKKTPYAADFIYRAKKRMKLQEPEQYFNTGVMLLNCKEIRQSFVWQDMLNYWKSVEFKSDDQDMFNSLFQGRVKFLDISWNVFARQNEDFSLIYEEAPKENYQEYLAARKSPKIVHFISEIKPWNVGQGDFVLEFWHIARGTPYYEALIEMVSGFQSQSVASYTMYQMNERTLHKKLFNLAKRIFNFFCPPGTDRHEVAKKCYFKIRGWDYIPPILPD